ncbi:hypothetical protein P4379_31935, partial [Bacillus toyonensis]|nr:hypothetical protein [Bacillus toyonensis]
MISPRGLGIACGELEYLQEYLLILIHLLEGPVNPVGNVKGGIGGSVGPIKLGFNAAAAKISLGKTFPEKSSLYIHSPQTYFYYIYIERI